jgi:hypothetical protein
MRLIETAIVVLLLSVGTIYAAEKQIKDHLSFEMGRRNDPWAGPKRMVHLSPFWI